MTFQLLPISRACVAVLALALASGACGDSTSSASDADGDTMEAVPCGLAANCKDAVDLDGLKVAGKDGAFSVEVVSHKPLTVADNEFVLRIVDADGNAVTDATLTVDVWSVDCMHGGPNPPETVHAEGDGTYVAHPVHVHGGPWDTIIDVDAGADTDAGAAHDRVTFHLCVTGDDHAHSG